MIDLDALNRCIDRFKELDRLEGMTEQVRGQQFNILIADVLKAHHIQARANQTTKGELDVCFRINDTRFMLEAKWEKGHINIDPIAKLGLRVNQRVPNNWGIVLSMNGFTRDALRDAAGRGSQNILLIERDLFVALLFGTVDAEALFVACVDVAAFEGKLHVNLDDIVKYFPTKRSPVPIDESVYGAANDTLRSLLQPRADIVEFSIVKAGLPFGQTGVSISKGTAYLTLIDGIYRLENTGLIRRHAIDNPQNRCIRSRSDDKVAFIRNGGAMAISANGEFSAVAKKQPGHVRLFAFEDEVNLFSNGDDFTSPQKEARIVRDIYSSSTEVICDYPVSCGADACIIDDSCYAVVGSSGLRLYDNHRQQWHVDVTNGAAVESYNGRLYFLENGVHLQSVALNGEDRRSVATFNKLSGSCGDFAIGADGDFYFHLCYRENDTTMTCLTHLKVGKPNAGA